MLLLTTIRTGERETKSMTDKAFPRVKLWVCKDLLCKSKTNSPRVFFPLLNIKLLSGHPTLEKTRTKVVHKNDLCQWRVQDLF